MQEINYHFFVSYTTREDEVSIIKPFVDGFIDIFRHNGASISASPIFYDYLSIGNGPKSPDKLRNLLIKGVRESVCMIAFVSNGYLSSPWCLFEWSMMDAVQIYRGPYFSAILPIKWKKIDNSGFIDTRKYIKIGPPKEKYDYRGEFSKWSWNSNDFIDCVFETIKFVNRRIYELHDFNNLQFNLSDFKEIEQKINRSIIDHKYNYSFC